jgi:hypothetical protein
MEAKQNPDCQKQIKEEFRNISCTQPFEDELEDAEEEVACEETLGDGDEGIPACIIISREENLFFEPLKFENV